VGPRTPLGELRALRTARARFWSKGWEGAKRREGVKEKERTGQGRKSEGKPRRTRFDLTHFALRTMAAIVRPMHILR